jgi:cytochrome c oxidase subunit II
MIEALHDVQAPGGVQAQAVYHLWLLLLAVCTIVFVAVMVALALALRRARSAGAEMRPRVEFLERGEPAVVRTVVIGVAVSVALLLGLLGASVYTSRTLAGMPLTDALHIELTAHQWWWEARYDDPAPSRIFLTANELHVPVGRPVLLTLRASDVIHSFWVPSLTGKKDLIPGREAMVTFRADHAGVYRGQCAEFCGYQHAKMALFVFADEPEAWQHWAEGQLAPAAAPRTALEARGRELFETGTCAMCHAIAGTLAGGRHAPDLTHVASRATLAAGAMPNDVAARTAWILDPQAIKPGVNMPATRLAPEDAAAITAFLGSLQ